MTEASAQLSPAQKAAATRRARRLAPVAPVAGFEDSIALRMDDAALLASLIGGSGKIASQLLARFGSFAETIAAPRSLLAQVDAAAAIAIELVRAAMTRALQGEVRRRPAISTIGAVVDHLRLAIGFEATECFRILFLDKRNQLIADETMGRGTVDHVPVYPREVLKRALELNACAMILAHNHPSGDTTPSRADVQMTQQLIEACKPVGIAIHDHVIVGRDGHTSLKALRLI